MNPAATPPIIAGAGPVGLAAALLLAHRGIRSRIIDKRAGRAEQSRALAVNPRTLELLECVGVSERLLQLGGRIVGAVLHDQSRTLARIDFGSLEHRYPFMLALSQAATERVLTEALAERGITIEREVELVGCEASEPVRATLLHHADGRRESVQCPWLLGADGAHSAVRQSLGLAFAGSAFERTWVLVDAPLETDLSPDHAHLVLLPDGFLFAMRVFTGEPQAEGAAPIWRLLGNLDDPLSRLHGARLLGEPLWQSEFHIAHRIVDRMQVGPILLAGDAAHIHSPAGARGMNQGIEDAWVLAALAQHGRLDRYDTLRRPLDRSAVRRIEWLTRMMRGESSVSRFARRLAPQLARIPPLRHRMLAVVTGLDHPVLAGAERAAMRGG